VSAPTRAESPASVPEAAIGGPLGRAIREARTAKKLSMRALAAAAEISQPFLSQIESGGAMPSLVTLFRIAKVLDISPASLLPAEADPAVIHVSRGADAKRVPIAEVENAATTRILSNGTTNVQEYLVEPGQYMGDWYESDGDLTVYVADGEITVEVEGHGSWDLGPGDAIAHPGHLRNRWVARGAAPVRIILVYAKYA
jgi:transcriptional regulator with XRE-family HTH domain